LVISGLPRGSTLTFRIDFRDDLVSSSSAWPDESGLDDWRRTKERKHVS
jgi:hypothetical protein